MNETATPCPVAITPEDVFWTRLYRALPVVTPPDAVLRRTPYTPRPVVIVRPFLLLLAAPNTPTAWPLIPITEAGSSWVSPLRLINAPARVPPVAPFARICVRYPMYWVVVATPGFRVYVRSCAEAIPDARALVTRFTTPPSDFKRHG